MNLKPFLPFILVGYLFAEQASADIGRHPSLTLNIKKNGKTIRDDAAIIHNGFVVGGRERVTEHSGVYSYTENFFDSEEYVEYFFWKVNKRTEFYNQLPEQIIILYPVDRDFNFYDAHSFNAYKSAPLHYAPFVYDHVYEANLNEEGSITLIPILPSLKPMVAKVFALTVLLELITAFIYLSFKRISFKILVSVIIGNLITLPIIWFLIPLFMSVIIFSFLLSEAVAVFTEAVVIRIMNKKYFTFPQSLQFSLLINVISAVIGGFLFYSA